MRVWTNSWCATGGRRLFSISLAMVALFSAIEAGASELITNGFLGAGNYTWDRRGATAIESSGQRPYYRTVTLEFWEPGTYRFELVAGFSRAVYLYQNHFQPTYPESNFWTNGFLNAQASDFTVRVNQRTTLVFVISSVNTGELGPYTLNLLDGPKRKVLFWEYLLIPTLIPNNDFQIVSPPSPAVVFSGQDSRVEVHAEGGLPHSWQWYFGDEGDFSQPVPGNSRGHILTLSSIESPTKVWVRVRNVAGENKNVPAIIVTPSNNPNAEFFGQLASGNPKWRVQKRIDRGGSNESYYRVVPFQVQRSGDYRINVAVDGAAFTPFINLYQNGFDPGFPKSNFWENRTPGGTYTTHLLPGIYEAVVSSNGTLQTGSFTGTITGPEPVVLRPSRTLGFLSQPEDVTLSSGSSVTLTASYDGAAPIAVQWYQGISGDTSQPISGATNSEFTTPSLATTTSYWIRLTGPEGIVDSRTVTVFVIAGALTLADDLGANSRQWTRPLGPGLLGDPADRHYYQAYSFKVGVTGTYRFRLEPSGFRPTVNVYAVSFDQTIPLNNFYNSHEQSGGDPVGTALEFSEFFFAGPGRYFFVVSSIEPLGEGEFQLTQVDGPALVTVLRSLTLLPADHAHADFGGREIGSSEMLRTFSIVNRDSSPLNLTGSPTIQILGSDADQFSVVLPPDTNIPRNGGSLSFEVGYSPTRVGSHSVTISIPNNNPDQNPFTFSVYGVGRPLPPGVRNPGGMVSVEQVNNLNQASSIILTTDLATNDFQVDPTVSNRGDFGLRVGADASDDLGMGIFLTTVSQNGVDHDQGDGFEIGASALFAHADGYLSSIHRAPDGRELNIDFAAVYFPFSDGWLAGHGKNSVNNGPLTSLHASSILKLNPAVGEFGLTDRGDGQYTLSLPGIDSVSDGILLVNGGQNDDNYALSRANVDGTWTIFNHDLSVNAGGYEPDPVAFAFVPLGLDNVVSGRVAGDASVILGSGAFTAESVGTGILRLSIPGHSPETGVLLVSPEGGESLNLDNIVTYEPTGSDWLVQTRDLPGDPPGLQNIGSQPAFSFAFFPTLIDAAPGITRASNLRIPDSATIRIQLGGTSSGSFDQFIVTGTVGIGTNVPLVIESENGFTPVIGARFLIVENNGTAAVSGIFDGLSEGAILSTDFLGSGLTATLSYVGGDGNDIEILVQAAEILITGLGNPIPNGDEDPSRDDNTDFGGVSLSAGEWMLGFEVQNSGLASLNLTGNPLVEISGPDAAAFRVVSFPSVVIGQGSQSLFQVSFDPSELRPYEAELRIASDDLSDPLYTFKIRGFGILDLPSDRVPAGNVRVGQLDTGNGAGSVSLVLEGASAGFQIDDVNSGRGDYVFQTDSIGGGAVGGGVLMTSIRRNGVDHGQGQGLQFGTSSSFIDSGNYVAALHQSPGGAEFNVDLGAVFLPFADGWIAGYADNSVNGGALTSLVTHPNAGLVLNPIAGQYGLNDLGGGVSELRLYGIDSNRDGVLLVSGGKNEDNFALSQAQADGSWKIYCHDNGVNGAAYEQDPIQFAFIPKSLTEIVSGRIRGEATVILGGGVFVTSRIAPGRIRLSIPGHSPRTGVLIVSPEGGESANVDNIVSYHPEGDGWQIEMRDIPLLGLQDVGFEAAFSFAFFPFLSSPIGTDDVVQRYQSDSAIKFSIPDLLANDLHPDGDPLAFSGLVSPTSKNGRSLTVIADRWIVYEPVAALGGPDDEFQYWVSDPDGDLSLSTVSVRERGDQRQSQNLQRQIVMSGEGRVELEFLGIPGRRYQLQFTEFINGDDTVWTDLGGVLSVGALGRFSNSDAVVAGQNRFYRVVEVRTGE